MIGPGFEVTAALRTRLVGLVELEDLDDVLEILLLGRTMAALRRSFGRVLVAPFFGVVIVLQLSGVKSLEQRQGLLKLALVALELGELGTLALDDLQQVLDLNFLRERDATKLLDVVFVA